MLTLLALPPRSLLTPMGKPQRRPSGHQPCILLIRPAICQVALPSRTLRRPRRRSRTPRRPAASGSRSSRESHLRLDGQLAAEMQLTETPALKLAARRLGKRPGEDDHNSARRGAPVDRELATDPAAGLGHIGAAARPPALGDDQVAAGSVRDS